MDPLRSILILPMDPREVCPVFIQLTRKLHPFIFSVIHFKGRRRTKRFPVRHKINPVFKYHSFHKESILVELPCIQTILVIDSADNIPKNIGFFFFTGPPIRSSHGSRKLTNFVESANGKKQKDLKILKRTILFC